MGWERVWTLALVQFGAEDIEIRILIGLGMALLTLMIVEGVRASFRIRRPKHFSGRQPQASKQSLAPAPASHTATRATVTTAALQPCRARKVVPRAYPKPVQPAANRHRPFKPNIRRRSAAAHKPRLSEQITQ